MSHSVLLKFDIRLEYCTAPYTFRVAGTVVKDEFSVNLSLNGIFAALLAKCAQFLSCPLIAPGF